MKLFMAAWQMISDKQREAGKHAASFGRPRPCTVPRSIRYGLVGSLILVPLLVMADTPPAATAPQPLIVEEADAVVELYEIRLHNVKMKAEEEDLKWSQVKENFERLEAAHKNGAVNERNYRDAKYDYNFWKHQDKVKDIEEAEVNLRLAKIRQKMARAGFRPYGTIADYGKE